MLNAILFPSDYFNKRAVDEALKREYDAAVDCGLFSEIILFSYEDWFHNEVLRLDKSPSAPLKAVYRGWMMQPEQYKRFYSALKERNIELITEPEEYDRFHVFPNVYKLIKNETPEAVFFPRGAEIDVSEIKKRFSRFMVKDYVKSVKGTDFPVFFDSSVTQEEFDGWMKKFYEYRGSLFTGGICIKEFVSLKKYGEYKNEYRVYYANGEVFTVSRNSGQPDYAPTPPAEMMKRYAGMGSPFYTVDYAEKENGEWIIIEAGDGGVSGLSDFQDYGEFFRGLYYAFME